MAARRDAARERHALFATITMRRGSKYSRKLYYLWKANIEQNSVREILCHDTARRVMMLGNGHEIVYCESVKQGKAQIE